MHTSHIIYVIGSAESPVKVGFANSLMSRMISLQIGNPDQLICHHFSRVSSLKAEAVERAAHRELVAFHRRGEWFDVHWLEAAAVVSRLAAEANAIIPPGDLFALLEAEHGMKPSGRAAVYDYLDRQERSDPYVPHANGYIHKLVGTAAYAAFSLVIAQQSALSGLNGNEKRRALTALAEAINLLCAFRSRYDKVKNDAAWSKERERLIAAPGSLRPRSLPPVRAA